MIPAESANTDVDRIAAVVRSVAGVADLHAGLFGEVGTHLPGRRVAGVRLGEPGTDIHVIMYYGVSVHRTADAIRDAISGLVNGPVDITVEDIEPVPYDSRPHSGRPRPQGTQSAAGPIIGGSL